jgi:Skp family chaperone for outer membrane proteins
MGFACGESIMRRPCVLVLWGLASVTVLIAGGCGTSLWSTPEGNGQAAATASSRLGGVAVIDLDEVAKQLGADAVLLKEINDGQASLNQQLRNFQSTLQAKYREKAQELETRPVAGGSAPDAKKQQLAELERELNLQLNQAQRTAANELGVYRQRLIQRFRDEVVPAAQEIAGQRGLGVVLTKNDSVLLAFDDAHDITAAVVAKLRARRAASTASTTNSPTPPAAERR